MYEKIKSGTTGRCVTMAYETADRMVRTGVAGAIR